MSRPDFEMRFSAYDSTLRVSFRNALPEVFYYNGFQLTNDGPAQFAIWLTQCIRIAAERAGQTPTIDIKELTNANLPSRCFT